MVNSTPPVSTRRGPFDTSDTARNCDARGRIERGRNHVPTGKKAKFASAGGFLEASNEFLIHRVASDENIQQPHPDAGLYIHRSDDDLVEASSGDHESGGLLGETLCRLTDHRQIVLKRIAERSPERSEHLTGRIGNHKDGVLLRNLAPQLSCRVADRGFVPGALKAARTSDIWLSTKLTEPSNSARDRHSESYA
jgi:hypothetical protein